MAFSVTLHLWKQLCSFSVTLVMFNHMPLSNKNLFFLAIVIIIFAGVAYNLLEIFDRRVEKIEDEILMEMEMSTIETIRHNGYEGEEFILKSPAGYYLGIHRIPRNGSIPILLLHGSGCTSSVWVDNTRNSLGYLLADNGYDVWMNNRRGNPYSKRHDKLSPSEEEFWNFSPDNCALEDLAEIIDFILKKTGKKKLFLLGHSVGTLEIFILLSTRTEYNSKVVGIITFSAIANFEVMKSPFHKIYKYAFLLWPMLRFANIFELDFTATSSKWLEGFFCWWLQQKDCKLLFIFSAGDPKRINATRTPLFLDHCKNGLAVNFVKHFVQIIGEKEFCPLHSKALQLPCYNISRLTAPISIFWAEKGDFVGHIKNLEWFKARLPNIYQVYTIPDEEFTHMDFLWGSNVKTQVYDKVVQTLDEMKSL